jgi:hypothetical protein
VKAVEPIPEDESEEIKPTTRRKPASGKVSTKTEKIRQASDDDEYEEMGRRSRTRRSVVAETPEQQFEVNNAEYTPSAFAGSNLSKKTRFGSTDNQGNRLSNLPGERPSISSVTPYDDLPD